MKKDKKRKYTDTSSKTVFGQPETAFELINKYGTYNIQPTCDSDNDFPKISQEISENDKR